MTDMIPVPKKWLESIAKYSEQDEYTITLSETARTLGFMSSAKTIIELHTK